MNVAQTRVLLGIVALAGTYVLAAMLGLAFAVVAEQVTLVWPPTGLALAALVLGGRRLWPGVLVGAFVANLWANAPVSVALSIAVGNTLEALLGAWLLERARVRPQCWGVRDAIVFAGIATFVSTPLGALWGATSLCAGGLQPWSAFVTLWRDWWIGDAVGALVVAPVILTWGMREPPRHAGEKAALFVGAAGVAVLGFALIESGVIRYPVHYLPFPFVMWAALRFGPRSAAMVVLLVAAIEVAGTQSGLGPFGAHPTDVGLLLMQMNVAVLATSGLALAAVSSERQRLAAELAARAAVLETRDRSKNEFLAMLGHELRNPLAPILQATGVMAGSASDPTTVQRLRAVIERQARQLTRLVDDLLDVARVTSGKIGLVRGHVDLARVLDAAIETSEPVLEAAGVTLTTTSPPEPVWVDGDSARLGQVVGNLLNNAARYTPEGGHAWLALERDGGVAVIRVRDDGVGMTPEVLRLAFDLFAQGPTTPGHAPGGLGVGLTLVREIVQLHGGTVEARSDGPGLGTELVVRLPVAAPAAEVAAHAGAPAGSKGAPTRRVLVVDDNEDAAETLALFLRAGGHEVQIAHDGPTALGLARADPPDIVLLDIGLPGMSGYEVARIIRSDRVLSQARVVAVTGYGQAEDARAAKDAGFDRHLVKPVDPEVLSEIVRACEKP